jgi:peptidoglycan/LPS O-acetylase OafA/YrhL
MLAGIFAFLVHGSAYTLTKTASERIDDTLQMGLFKRLGDLSYGVYLMHLLVLIPVMALFVEWGFSPLARFLSAFLVTAAIVYMSATVTFKYIERPGIRLGKAVLAKRQKNPPPLGDTVVAQEAP